MIKAVGIDFDGTLIMSEDIKAREMANVFREKFHLTHGVEKAYADLLNNGFNREEKVRRLFQKLLKRLPTKRELQIVKRHFGQHYRRSLRTCPLFQCTTILTELRNQVSFLFLLSLEDRAEVYALANHCSLARYFDQILGGPNSKEEHLRRVMKQRKLKPSEVLYIGDSHSDVSASKKMGIKVVLVGKKHTAEKLKEDLEADFTFSSLCLISSKVIR